MAESDDVLGSLMVVVACFLLFTAAVGAMKACSDVDDVKVAVCVEAYQRAATATDTLRVHRTTKCGHSHTRVNAVSENRGDFWFGLGRLCMGLGVAAVILAMTYCIQHVGHI